MGERNVDLSAYVPPDVRNTGALGGGQLQVELDDEDDHFGGGPPRPPQQSTPKPPPPPPPAPAKPKYSKPSSYTSYQAGTRR
uniref:Uncharacterized protein n=1 Tax=Meloidogyne enterolobii TaxID=390850 RepID=A0A6V7U3F1_MELEN|nr:unnamed protein product [Meloidogyne enterolobii]CAD2148844.1 unnamed protein product [Meloidogyne enterolobii]